MLPYQREVRDLRERQIFAKQHLPTHPAPIPSPILQFTSSNRHPSHPNSIVHPPRRPSPHSRLLPNQHPFLHPIRLPSRFPPRPPLVSKHPEGQQLVPRIALPQARPRCEQGLPIGPHHFERFEHLLVRSSPRCSSGPWIPHAPRWRSRRRRSRDQRACRDSSRPRLGLSQLLHPRLRPRQVLPRLARARPRSTLHRRNHRSTRR